MNLRSTRSGAVCLRQCSKANLLTVSVRTARTLAKMRGRHLQRQLRELGRKYDEYNAGLMSELKETGEDAIPLATDGEFTRVPDYSPRQKDQSGGESVPFVKPLNEPYPTAPFNEVRPEPLLVWNDFQERYELRDKRILSEKTKQTLLSIHRRDPLNNRRETLATKFGLSRETIDFIFWEDTMRRKYKIPYDLDTIKLLEAYCGTDDLLESKAYAMMAYSEVSGDPYFANKGSLDHGNPLLMRSDEFAENLYSWQRKAKHKPRLVKDHYDMIPEQGAGSGQPMTEVSRMRDKEDSVLIVDVEDDDISQMHDRHLNVKVRESNGLMRWATVDECNWVKMREYPTQWTPFQRIRKRKVRERKKRKFPRQPFVDRYYQESHWW